MSSSHVMLERDGHLGRLRLTRPEKRNAQTTAMWEELRRIGAELLRSADLRVLIVEGDGPVFSAGIDLSVLAGQASGENALSIEPELVQQAFTWLREVPFPTIAAVQGAALGAGCQLALACDLRILAHDAVIGLPEISFGIFPDLGGCAWLPELVGTAKAKELIFTGARIDANEALRLGLANRVVPAAELAGAVTALAEELAAKAPLGIAAAKRAIAASVVSADAALRCSATEVRRLLASEDFREAVTAAAERRAPRFQAR